MGKRLVVLPWTCQRSGDCCQGPSLVMTHGERATLEQHADQALAPLVFRPHATAGLVTLEGTPCPFLFTADDGHTECAVYEHRPYNCRRFACYRPDPATEPLERGNVLGCKNAEDRFRASAPVRADYQARQDAAYGWAWAHGWETER